MNKAWHISIMFNGKTRNVTPYDSHFGKDLSQNLDFVEARMVEATTGDDIELSLLCFLSDFFAMIALAFAYLVHLFE